MSVTFKFAVVATSLFVLGPNRSVQVALATPITISLQQGVDGYTGTSDTYLNSTSPALDRSTVDLLIMDGNDALDQVLLRFDLLGVLPGPLEELQLISATLTLFTDDDGTSSARAHRMLQSWDDTDTWNDWVSGVQPDGIEAESAFTTFASPTAGSNTFDVFSSVGAWLGGQENDGWLLLNPNSNAWRIRSSEYTTIGDRPLLSMTFNFVPEPSSLGLLSLGLAFAWQVRRRRRRPQR